MPTRGLVGRYIPEGEGWLHPSFSARYLHFDSDRLYKTIIAHWSNIGGDPKSLADYFLNIDNGWEDLVGCDWSLPPVNYKMCFGIYTTKETLDRYLSPHPDCKGLYIVPASIDLDAFLLHKGTRELFRNYEYIYLYDTDSDDPPPTYRTGIRSTPFDPDDLSWRYEYMYLVDLQNAVVRMYAIHKGVAYEIAQIASDTTVDDVDEKLSQYHEGGYFDKTKLNNPTIFVSRERL